jgi:hypothetical protein
MLTRLMRAAPRSAFVSLSIVLGVACGGSPPPPASAPTKPEMPAAKAEAPIDLSPVPEPAGLLLVGRVAKPEGILKTVGGWTHLPLPTGDDLVRSMADDAVGAVVDLAQPIDGAVVLGSGRREPVPLTAFAVAVRSYDEAKSKLGSRHRLTAGSNGQLTIEGLGKGDGDDDDDETCVLAPSAEPKGSGRIVCGEKPALEALVPYLTRTTPRQSWPSDVHVEMRVAPLREPLDQLRTTLPILARSLMGGQSPALRELAESLVGEAVDFASDANRLTIDAQLGDPGADATVRVEYQRAQSLLARVSTSNGDRAAPPPPALMHLPAETDLAFYSRGSDPKLFDHARDLMGRVAMEAAEGIEMPESERKTVRDLVVDRMFSLFTGPLVYGKGFDAAAVEKAVAARKAVKPDDVAGHEEAERVLAEQVLGWHLVQVSEPIAKVGPVLKDWASLWQRPTFVAWMKKSASAKMMARVRLAPMPAGVTLPKESVHLEVVVPQHEIDVAPSRAAGRPAPKKITPKPVVMHVYAVPDQGATWIGFGLDGKLVGQRASASLASAPDKETLGKSGALDALRDTKANGAWIVTLRGLLVFTALKNRDRTPFAMTGTLPHKGASPIFLTYVAEGPSARAGAGSAVSTFKLPRAAIEDIARLVMSGGRP